MDARAKSISLLLYNGTMQGVVGIEDSAWYSGEMYISPRDSVASLLESGACDKHGVYLLLSHEKVYVGQSSGLARRIAQHVAGKDWWESVVILTTKDDSFGHSDIDWLEGTLIEMARSAKWLDCDNRQRGNPKKVDRFRKVFLEQYLHEALFLMDVVGISVFSRAKRKTQFGGPIGMRIDLTDVHNRLAFGKRVKRLAIEYAESQGVSVETNANYAVLKENGSEFFLNPQRTCLTSNWGLVLNDTYRCELVVLMVPANSLRMADEGHLGLMPRKDDRRRIDLHIGAEDLKDRRSGISFLPYLVSRVAY